MVATLTSEPAALTKEEPPGRIKMLRHMRLRVAANRAWEASPLFVKVNPQQCPNGGIGRRASFRS